VVLVAEGRDRDVDRRHLALPVGLGLGVLDGPSRIAVLLPELRGLVLPALRKAALLERLLFGLGVALLRCRDDGRVHELA
jgi:hypothetical protein